VYQVENSSKSTRHLDHLALELDKLDIYICMDIDEYYEYQEGFSQLSSFPCMHIYIYIYPCVSNYLSDLPTVYPREIHGCSVLGPDEAGRTEGRDLGMAPGDPNKGNAASRHHFIYIYTNLYKYIHIYIYRVYACP
jgi:hypothetical protein